MLVLSRKKDEPIYIETTSGEVIRIIPVRIGPHAVRLGLEAPRDVKIHRGQPAPEREQPLAESPPAEAKPAA